jgi:putative ABC transport system permease protein
MNSRRIPLMWRWSWRDMRERWLQLLGIAFIIALGVAVHGGLASSVPWRQKSFDKSYEMLNMFDLKLELTSGSYLETEQLAKTVRSVPHADWIEDLETRLSFPTSVDASTPEQYLFVSGEVIGVDVAGGGPVVNKLYVTSGRGLDAGDAGAPVAVVEENFANYHGLVPGDRSLRIGGGHVLDPVGIAISPEHFMVVEEESGVMGAMAQDRFAVLFVPLLTAQEIADLPGKVNQVLITVPEALSETDLDQLKIELQGAIAQTFPEIGVDLEKRSENASYRVLQDDIVSDKELLDTLSYLLLLGAAFAAFILIARIVDAQRREIGINMALGAPPRRIARRYLLIGAQIALLGVLFGAAFSLLINRPLAKELQKMIPASYYDTSFQTDIFVQGALIGVLIPFLAVIYPVWRAVRVAPVDAIQTGYYVSKGGGLAPLLARIPLPGSSFTLFPVRNLSRGLRRTTMTVLGIAIAVSVLIAVIGMVDTFVGILDAGSQELRKEAPNRTQVMLDDFYPLLGSVVSEIDAEEGVAQAVPSIVLPGKLAGDKTFDVMIQMMDLDNDLWTPTIKEGGTNSEGPGILIAEKAARDLGVEVGDTVTLQHPYRVSRYAWHLIQTPVRVIGIHGDVLRIPVYMDIEYAAIMNLDDLVNSLYVNPAAGVNMPEFQRTLAQIQGVASVRRVLAAQDRLKSFLDQYIGVFQAMQFVVLVMAFLVAFNTTRTNMEERQRDIATMFAFGTRVRTAIRMAMTENLIIGLLGTALGIGLGWLLLSTTLLGMFERDAPELGTVLTVSQATYGWAVLIGVIVVALTPILMTRRLVRMDIPSTLRVIE